MIYIILKRYLQLADVRNRRIWLLARGPTGGLFKHFGPKVMHEN